MDIDFRRRQPTPANALMGDKIRLETKAGIFYDKDGNLVFDEIDVTNDYLAISNSAGIYAYYTFRTEDFFADDIEMYAISSSGIKTYDKFSDGIVYATVDVEAHFCEKNFMLSLVQ